MKKRPDFIVCSVVDLEDEKSRWREVGVGFWNAKSDSMTILLDAVPLSGRLVVTKPKNRTAGDVEAEGVPF